MQLAITELMVELSHALDYVETELIGVQTNHSKRVAYLCALLGKYAGMTREERLDLVTCGVLHDNALTEYVQAEYHQKGKMPDEMEEGNIGIHCTLGERNVEDFPFFTDVRTYILYHHENADGSGPFLKREEEIPLPSRIIHIADRLDAQFSLKTITEEKWEDIRKYVMEQRGKEFGGEEAALFLNNITIEDMERLSDELLEGALASELEYVEKDYSPESIMKMSGIFARIIDYKSTFTSFHSMGIAKKAYAMGEYYGETEEMCAKLFLAGALHDIGKLAVDVNILEKPGKLTAEEFEEMKRHALVTHEILSRIHGMEDICRWAAHHHEKLNGKGYPFGYEADRLDKYERLLGCIDIYQALCEDRPYKPGKSHEEIMAIMGGMVDGGFIDGDITSHIGKVFG